MARESDESGAGPAAPIDASQPVADATSEGEAVAGHSITAARWIVASRMTGFVRAVVIAAVLGPTYLGNTYLAVNQIPNFTYEFLTGSLFVGLLVPALVRHVDARDTRSVERIAGGFLTFALVGFAAVIAFLVLVGPLVLELLAIGVDDRDVASDQRRVGYLLLVMLIPQLAFYGIAGIGAAVQNAHGRFALAAAAPILENVGIVATMAVTAVLFGTGQSLESVGTAQLLLLGLGTTGAVAMHAAAQVWGAWRVGVRLRPHAGWREPEVRAIMRRTLPSLGYSGLNTVRYFVMTIVANSVQGGVVAFTLALNFFYMAPAIGTQPVATAFLPRLSRLFHRRAMARFHDELVRNIAVALFVIIPAAVAYLVLAVPLARATAFGEMAGPDGVDLLAASLAALSAGMIGESIFVVATYAAYALHDVRAPFVSMVVRTCVSMAGALVALLLFDGVGVLVALGLAVTLGNNASAWHLVRRLRAALPRGSATLKSPAARALAASALMAAPAYLVAMELPLLVDEGELRDVVAMLLAAGVGLAAYVTAQRAWHSPELAFFVGGIRTLRSGRTGDALVR